MIPTVDLAAWRAGGSTTTSAGRAVDAALQQAGFLLVTGHDVAPELAARVRAVARRFFALPVEVKDRYAIRIGGRGWMRPGVQAAGWVEGTRTPPDLMEAFVVGPPVPTGDPTVDGVWFLPNVWPVEVPELREVVGRYVETMVALSLELLELCAGALGLPGDVLTGLARHPTWTFNINRYPSLAEAGVPAPGQFRVGPHTDFGTVTVLDREPGAGGLQIDIDGAGWTDAPYDPAALTVNVGDLLAHWTGLRWRSGRHRVLPPPAAVPGEELVSLVFFFELDHDAVVTPLVPPIGLHADLGPVVSAPFLRARLDALSVPDLPR